MSTSPHALVSPRVDEDAFNPTVHIADRNVNQHLFYSTSSRGMPLVTGLCLDIELLAETLWVWLSSQILMQEVVHPSSPCFYIWWPKCHAGSVTLFMKYQVDDISCFPLMHWCCNSITESNQVHKVWFTWHSFPSELIKRIMMSYQANIDLLYLCIAD